MPPAEFRSCWVPCCKIWIQNIECTPRRHVLWIFILNKHHQSANQTGPNRNVRHMTWSPCIGNECGKKHSHCYCLHYSFIHQRFFCGEMSAKTNEQTSDEWGTNYHWLRPVCSFLPKKTIKYKLREKNLRNVIITWMNKNHSNCLWYGTKAFVILVCK